MNFRHSLYISLLFVSVTFLLFTSSCSALTNIFLSVSEVTPTASYDADYHAKDKTNVFYVDSPQICCTAKLSGVSSLVDVKANWVYVKGDVPLEGSNPTIQTDKLKCDNDCYIGFTMFAPIQGFTAGEYRVEIEIDSNVKAYGTYYVKKDTSGPLPVINSFKAESLNITAGQSPELTWKVTGATRVYIEPKPGTVALEGNQTVSPTTDTSYTLWALNRRGCSSGKITIDVTQPVTDKCDLTVTEMNNTGNILYYRVKNIGTIASCPSESYLFKSDLLVSKDYVDTLAPGAERVESFSQYHFSPRFASSSATMEEGKSSALNMRICVNGNSACAETNVENNCIDQNFGSLLTLNLGHYAGSAEWKTSVGSLKWPTSRSSKEGVATTATAQMDDSGGYPGALVMIPPSESNGWIEGRFGLPQAAASTPKPFTVPHKCKFSARVGLTQDTSTSANVIFTLGTMQGSEVSFYPPVIINTKGKLETYEIDLSKLAGKQLQFVLRVESDAPLQQGSAVWVDPSLIQER